MQTNFLCVMDNAKGLNDKGHSSSKTSSQKINITVKCWEKWLNDIVNPHNLLDCNMTYWSLNAVYDEDGMSNTTKLHFLNVQIYSWNIIVYSHRITNISTLVTVEVIIV